MTMPKASLQVWIMYLKQIETLLISENELLVCLYTGSIYVVLCFSKVWQELRPQDNVTLDTEPATMNGRKQPFSQKRGYALPSVLWQGLQLDI